MASRALKLAIAGIATALAIAATLVLYFAEDIDREFGEPPPATRPWSAQEIEAWLPSAYDEQAHEVAGHRTRIVGVRCDSRESLAQIALDASGAEPDLQARLRAAQALSETISLDAFLCEARAVTGRAESTTHLCGFNGVRATDDGRVEEQPTLLDAECREDG